MFRKLLTHKKGDAFKVVPNLQLWKQTNVTVQAEHWTVALPMQQHTLD